jgi:hypothetical protein
MGLVLYSALRGLQPSISDVDTRMGAPPPAPWGPHVGFLLCLRTHFVTQGGKLVRHILG